MNRRDVVARQRAGEVTMTIILRSAVLLICTTASAAALQQPEPSPKPAARTRAAEQQPPLDPVPTELQIGQEYAAQLRAAMLMARDAAAREYVNGIARRLAPSCGPGFSFDVQIIDSEMPDAVPLPAGFLFLSSGLILATDDEAELAAIVAHEVAHICAHHFIRGATPELLKITRLRPIMINGSPHLLIDCCGEFPPLDVTSFRPEFEAEADALALQYLIAAGYDPVALRAVFEKLMAREKQKPSSVAKRVIAHFPTAERTAAIQAKISQMPSAEEYTVTTSQFEATRSRLLLLTAARANTRR